VIYAGTGEHFTNDIDGAGMFKSTDKGLTWTQIADPSVYPDFENVSRIIVNPADENMVLATTRSSVWGAFSTAIYKTTDGGITWRKVRSSTNEQYDDLDFSPADFNLQFAAVEGRGVIKSTDAGETWVWANNGMNVSGRIEIAISSLDPARIWASVEGTSSGNGSDLYVSFDGAATWSLVTAGTGTNHDFLGGQGWYNNTLVPHPYDVDAVYVGGVDVWKFTLGTGTTPTSYLGVYENGIEKFMSFVNFGGEYYNGALDRGTYTLDQLPNVEVRFGQGTQFAYRFTVGGQGSGVPVPEYIYRDYVEVPFQVWDVSANRQLMVSFRDQQEDGAWNLIPQNTQSTTTSEHSREYLYIHNTTYSATANSAFTINGGHVVDQLFFFWPVLAPQATFDPLALPVSNLAIQKIAGVKRQYITTVISDVYGQINGPNQFEQSSRLLGIHPDQHNLVIIPGDNQAKTFSLLAATDGGIYQSLSTTDPGAVDGDFTYVSEGLNTTQFYSADKAPGEERFFGGMQDNGSWYTPAGTVSSATSRFDYGFGGDGFDAVWNNSNSLEMIGSSQYNRFGKTLDGGTNWYLASTGLYEGASPLDNWPFVSRIANSKLYPTRLFTVGAGGVYYSENFGSSWIKTPIGSDLWGFHNSYDVVVSEANPDVIWAGGYMSAVERLFVSDNGGKLFRPTFNYEGQEMGYVTGIGTHPVDHKTAFALFSFAGKPKILKTSDLGLTWNDISGFDGTGDRGFPDVAVNCLFVFPNDTSHLWAGTEIGIVESMDGGATWGLLVGNMPPVTITDFKLTDDQLTIATYGRGIWSVQLPGLTLPALVQQAYMTPTGDFKLEVTYRHAYDSTKIFVGTALMATIVGNQPGQVTETIQNRGFEGFVKVRLESYLNGIRVRSIEKEVLLFDPKPAATSYGTNFYNSTGEFVGRGFSIKSELGFKNFALHSAHPYKENTELVQVLKTPVVVAQADAFLSYMDIAIVEPGDVGTLFGDADFWDYVIVEGTTDGVNWKPFEVGYDARKDPSWLDAYLGSRDINYTYYRKNRIDMQKTFAAGDTVMVRFRLFSDPGAIGWGWVIDDVYIQEEPLGIDGEATVGVKLWPNPISREETLRLDIKGADPTARIQVLTLDGRVVRSYQLDKPNQQLSINPAMLAPGVYVVILHQEGKTVSQKLVVQ
ncbi:MAG: T9SS type A sorting domain-containing protein, partial [Cyclobacteriaceae bacterium]|nr:T9SS type A sorting domain-containing protein [Cyclobacteriaceae bacterium]